MGIINGIIHKNKRRTLRKLQTPEELFVWKMLRGRSTGLKWRRQVSIGNYVTDFYCTSKKIALELDGEQHEGLNYKEYDSLRTKFFNEQGIRVIRISNKELNEDPVIIYERIQNEWGA